MADFFVSCPCCGVALAASDAGFQAVTVEVTACPTQQANGVRGFTLRKSVAYAAAIPVDGPVRHRDGLVTFG